MAVVRVVPAWRALAMFSLAKQDSASLRIENEFSWKIRCEMLRHTNRAHTRAAATVGNAKCLVQIQVTNVCAVITGAAKADLRVQVRTVHINLAAMRVYDVANFANRRLKNSMCGGIRHHQRREVARVFICLCAQTRKIDISIF